MFFNYDCNFETLLSIYLSETLVNPCNHFFFCKFWVKAKVARNNKKSFEIEKTSIVASFALQQLLCCRAFLLVYDTMSNVSPTISVRINLIQNCQSVSHMYLPHVQLSNLQISNIYIIDGHRHQNEHKNVKSNFAMLVCIHFLGTLFCAKGKVYLFLLLAH